MAKSWLKKIAAMMAVCMMLGCLSGCNGGETPAEEGTSESGEATTSEVEDTSIKVGYIFNAEVDNSGYTAMKNSQRLAASKYTTVQSYYIDNVSITDFPEAVKRLTDIGCEYIVSGSWLYHNMLTDVAGKNMNVNFISHGARVRTVNVSAYTDQMYEGAYIAGMAAAYNSETEKIGIVIDPGMIYATPVINAAALGTQLVFKDAQLHTAYAVQPAEIRNAVDALSADGCDVIICYTESPEAAEYCNSKGIKFIGSMDYTDNAKDYQNMLMYFYSDHDSYYLAQFKQMQLEAWEPEEYVGTLANGIVNVSTVLPAAKDGTQDIVSALLPKVANGQAYIFAGELKDNHGNVQIMQGDSIEPASVYSMSWFVKGVVNQHDSFVVPKTDLDTNDFDIES